MGSKENVTKTDTQSGPSTVLGQVIKRLDFFWVRKH